MKDIADLSTDSLAHLAAVQSDGATAKLSVASKAVEKGSLARSYTHTHINSGRGRGVYIDLPLGPISARILPGLASPLIDHRILFSATSTHTSLNDRPAFSNTTAWHKLNNY